MIVISENKKLLHVFFDMMVEKHGFKPISNDSKEWGYGHTYSPNSKEISGNYSSRYPAPTDYLAGKHFILPSQWDEAIAYLEEESSLIITNRTPYINSEDEICYGCVKIPRSFLQTLRYLHSKPETDTVLTINNTPITLDMVNKLLKLK